METERHVNSYTMLQYAVAEFRKRTFAVLLSCPEMLKNNSNIFLKKQK